MIIRLLESLPLAKTLEMMLEGKAKDSFEIMNDRVSCCMKYGCENSGM